MASIYDQHTAAFSSVSAYVVLKDGERVATVAFKFPKDGASRLWAYVHWFGNEMVRGFAAGGGYDKRTAAAADAVDKSPFRKFGATPGSAEEAFHSALLLDAGCSWARELEKAGFTVLQAL